MAGIIEANAALLVEGAAESTFDQVINLVLAVRTELILFCLAFLLHQLIFGSAFPRAMKLVYGGKRSKKIENSGAPPGLEEPNDGASSSAQALRWSQQAFERGDHRGVLRLWNALRRSDKVPATHLAQVVESMQRLKKDGASILAEVQAYFRRNKTVCDITYVNPLLETVAKSLDTELVNGLLEFLASMGIHPDSHTFEMLMQMQFAVRNFKEVSQLSEKMDALKVMPTARINIILLKTAIQAGKLDESLRRFKQVSFDTGVATISAAPKHLVAQLVDLACREGRVDVVLAQLDDREIHLSTELVNSLLAEGAKLKDSRIIERVKEIAASQGVELNGRSYQMLARAADDDRQQISKLITQMQKAGVECTQEMATSVLSVCWTSGDSVLADQLFALVAKQRSNIPALCAFVRFYAEVGQPEAACSVYDQHLKLQDFCSNEKQRSNLDSKTERSLITAALKCGRKDIAADLVVSSPADTAKHINMIQNCASKGSLDEALDIFDALEASGAELTHSLYNTLLDACVECRDTQKAKALMQRMLAAGMVDAVSYNTLIKAHLRHEDYEAARSVMETMRKAGCIPNVVTYNELIHALVRSEKEIHRSQVWDVVDEMKISGVSPNRITCSILFRSLKARSPQTDVVRTMELTESMVEPMDEVLMSSLIEACVRIGKPGLLTEKLEQLQGKEAAIKVTGAHTFGSLIKAYGTAKDMDGAWRCWKAMRSQHVRPTSITIGCMVEAVVSNGDADGGYELITQLLEDKQCRSQVNSVVFGSVLKGFGRTRRMDRVWAVFKEMLSRGVAPAVETFNSVIDSCVRNNEIEAVSGLLEDMKARGLQPNLITYSTIIKGVCQAGNMTAAFSTLKDLRNSPGVRADEIVYNTMLDGCATAGLVAEGEQLLEEMQKDGLAPSNYTLTVMVRLMGQGRRLPRAFEMVDLFFQKHRIRPNSHVYNALIQACLTCRELSRAADVFEQSLRSRHQPDRRICHSVIRCHLSAGKAERAVDLLRALLGLPLSHAPALKTNPSITETDDAFINETLSSLLDRGGDASALAPPLVADVKAVRPQLRLDPATDRSLALAVARRCSTAPARKQHPWSK